MVEKDKEENSSSEENEDDVAIDSAEEVHIFFSFHMETSFCKK